MTEVLSEQDKYTRMWEIPEYRAVAPGEHCLPKFIEVARPRPGSTVTDFGCGTGRASLALLMRYNLSVRLLDFASNCLDPMVRNVADQGNAAFQFTQHDLTKPAPVTSMFAICSDVMEHIPTKDVDKVLGNILLGAQFVFFQIDCQDDVMGARIGHPLHLTVKPFAWWLSRLQRFDAQILWSKDHGNFCQFYVTAWPHASEITKAGRINVTDETVRRNVETNLKAGWTHAQPNFTLNDEVMILGGGPSMKDQLPEIKRLREEGVRLVTLNGAYNWCLENDLIPSATIIVDARPFNARFTKPVPAPYIKENMWYDCKYLISSQCDPSVLEGLPKERVFLWHSAAEDVKDLLDEHSPDGIWYHQHGGSTVLLRAFTLLRFCGYRKFHLFGCDSCLEISNEFPEKRAHHAYAQPENDNQPIVEMIANKRTFQCHPWMASQAEQFEATVGSLDIDLIIYGDGLLKAIVDEAASLSDEQEFLK